MPGRGRGWKKQIWGRRRARRWNLIYLREQFSCRCLFQIIPLAVLHWVPVTQRWVMPALPVADFT